MKAFLSANDVKRKEEARALACNPCPGRPSRHYHKITRTLLKINDRIAFHLATQKYEPRKWLPFEGVIDDRDDEWQEDLHAQFYAGEYTLEEDGHTPDFHDPGIKATNRIVAVTWYSNDQGEGYLIKKPIISPLPCPTWGRLPITLAQWRHVAMTLIEMEQLWRWVHSVRYYTQDPSFVVTGIAGWHMEPTRKIVSHRKLADAGEGYIIDMRSDEEKELEAEGWHGQILLQDITDGFSLVESTE